MSANELIAHDRMLVGAIDSFMGSVVHTRPFLASAYREQLERMAERWINEGGPNALAAVTSEWLHSYLASAEEPEKAELAVRELYTWALNEELIAASPLS